MSKYFVIDQDGANAIYNEDEDKWVSFSQEEVAEAEANRLANENPGDNYFVCKAIIRSQAQIIPAAACFLED